MLLHQNISFTLFAKFGLKTGMHMLLQQINYFRRSVIKLSVHYYMITFIIAWYLHIS